MKNLLGEYTNPNEIVNISLTQVNGSSADLIGASVTITNDDTGDTLLAATWNGSTIITEIDINTNYTVSVDSINGYKSPSSQSYTAMYQNERNVSFQYVALGAFVEATDGTLYTASSWSSAGKTANSVVFITENISVRIALVEAGLFISNNEQVSKDNYLEPLPDRVLASVDYNGKSNTAKLVRFNIAYNTNTNSYAAPYCNNYTFPDGITKAYLPASGQALEIAKNKTQINNCLTVCGGTL